MATVTKAKLADQYDEKSQQWYLAYLDLKERAGSWSRTIHGDEISEVFRKAGQEALREVERCKSIADQIRKMG